MKWWISVKIRLMMNGKWWSFGKSFQFFGWQNVIFKFLSNISLEKLKNLLILANWIGKIFDDEFDDLVHCFLHIAFVLFGDRNSGTNCLQGNCCYFVRKLFYIWICWRGMSLFFHIMKCFFPYYFVLIKDGRVLGQKKNSDPTQNRAQGPVHVIMHISMVDPGK